MSMYTRIGNDLAARIQKNKVDADALWVRMCVLASDSEEYDLLDERRTWLINEIDVLEVELLDHMDIFG